MFLIAEDPRSIRGWGNGSIKNASILPQQPIYYAEGTSRQDSYTPHVTIPIPFLVILHQQPQAGWAPPTHYNGPWSALIYQEVELRQLHLNVMLKPSHAPVL